MFTGLIEATGEVVEHSRRPGGDVRIRIATPPGFTDGLLDGASVACSGACMTALEIAPDGFSADVSNESLQVTTLGQWRTGTTMNLERSLTLQKPLGGHLVQGHVDGVATVVGLEMDAASRRVRIEAPRALARFIASKGSVALDGVSLTVNEVSDQVFGVNLIPHTWEVTTLGRWAVGMAVNIEVDLMARYAQRLLETTGRSTDD